MTIDQALLIFWKKYITGTYHKSHERYRNLKNGQYVCSTGLVRAYPRYSKVKFYTDFYKEEK